MNRTLSSRLLIGFLLTILTLFVILNTYGMSLLTKRLTKKKEESLGRQANLIVSESSEKPFNLITDNNYLNFILKSLEKQLGIRTWIVNPYGKIVIDSAGLHLNNSINVNTLDPDFLENTLHHNTLFPGIIDEPMLSYIHTTSRDFSIKGYIVLHTPESSIKEQVHLYIDIINICLLIFFIILLLVFLYVYYITIIPWDI